MSLLGGTQVNVGVGIETTPGTAVAATHFLQWTDLSIQGIAEKELFNAQRGVRNMASNSIIKRKYSEGSVSMVPNVNDAAVIFYLALGSKSSSGVVDSAYTHTFTVQNANGSMKTATFIVEDGTVVVERYAGCVVESWNMEVSDSYANLTASIRGGFPTSSTLTESFSQETNFTYSDMTVKFGTSLAAAASASATPLKSLTLNYNNNIQADEAFLSGSNEPVAGKFAGGRVEVTGNYTLHFEDTTELAKYKANTKNACIIQFLGALIGAASKETITIKLGRLVLTDAPKQYNLDGIVVLQQGFTVEYEATDKEIQIEVINDTATYA